MSLEQSFITKVVEAALMAAGQPVSLDKLHSLFNEQEAVEKDHIVQALTQLNEDLNTRGVELKEVSSGYRIQAKQDYAPWLAKLWEEKPPRYSRAVLETMVLIAYRQPITRSEIEDVRGVSVSSHIIKSLLERDWVRVVGHRDVPGRPALYATTKGFLDYFNLKSLDELPTLSEIKDLDSINAQLNLNNGEDAPALAEVEPSESASVVAAQQGGDAEAGEFDQARSLSDAESSPSAVVAQGESETAAATGRAKNKDYFAQRLPPVDESSDALNAVDAALSSTKDVLERFERAVFHKDEDITAEEADIDSEDLREEQAISDAIEALAHHHEAEDDIIALQDRESDSELDVDDYPTLVDEDQAHDSVDYDQDIEVYDEDIEATASNFAEPDNADEMDDDEQDSASAYRRRQYESAEN